MFVLVGSWSEKLPDVPFLSCQIYFLPVWRYASEGTSMAIFLFVCVCHKSHFCCNGRADRAGFGMETSFLLSILHCWKEIQVSTKTGLRVLPSGTLFYTPDEKFCNSVSIVATCCQLSSTKVDACFIINWTVVWLLLLVDNTCKCSVWIDSWFIPPIIHLCLQQEEPLHGYIYDSW